MKIFRDKTDYDGTVVALGNFDGLHIAHMTIIRNGIKYAKENGLKSGVLLFEENTNDVVGHKIELITPNEAKLELLEREKPDFVYMEKFDKEFMKKTPEEFVQYLVENLHIKAVCVGYDYSFGYKAQGDVKLLKWFGEKYGFKVFVTDVIKLDGKVVSSRFGKAGPLRSVEREKGKPGCDYFFRRKLLHQTAIYKQWPGGVGHYPARTRMQVDRTDSTSSDHLGEYRGTGSGIPDRAGQGPCFTKRGDHRSGRNINQV